MITKRINFAFFIFILVLLLSCNNNRIEKEYDNEGRLKKEIYYSGNEIRKIVDYYSNGTIYSCSKFSNYNKGDCVITLYSIEGKIIGLMNYVNGLKHGEFIWYDTNGKTLFKETYYNGILVQ